MRCSEFCLVRAARNTFAIEGKQKGQKGRAEAKRSFRLCSPFLPFLLPLPIFKLMLRTAAAMKTGRLRLKLYLTERSHQRRGGVDTPTAWIQEGQSAHRRV
jgi:hypothetical protein